MATYTQAEFDDAVADAVAKATADLRARADAETQRAQDERARADAERIRADAERDARIDAERREAIAVADANLLRIQNDYERERADRAVQLAYVSILLVHRPRFVLAHSDLRCRQQAKWTRFDVR
jgi:hypothetical protein